MIEMVVVHLKLNQVHLKELFYEKLIKRSIHSTFSNHHSSSSGLARADIEVYLFE